MCYVPKARTTVPKLVLSQHRTGHDRLCRFDEHAYAKFDPKMDLFYPAHKRTQIFFPDKRLLEFDSGKLTRLATLLFDLKRGDHKCLIFTQMSKMLDTLETFLCLHGYTYVRLDGSTKVEMRQKLMERFNKDPKLFVFILSTRSGGLGINLVGADTVIFYDTDWNPAMDAQAQDRAHRIGQTRDVHIYRLVCEHSVEENILKKAQQKRHLDFLAITSGNFTTDFFSENNLKDMVGEKAEKEGGGNETDSKATTTDIDETYTRPRSKRTKRDYSYASHTDGTSADEMDSDDDDDNDDAVDENFEVASSEDDDETTLAREEERQKKAGECVKKEISSLKEEGEMSIEELRKKYCMDGAAGAMSDSGPDENASDDDDEGSNGMGSDGVSDSDDDEDFEGGGSEEDDESTLAREEARQKQLGVKADAEISSLEKEGEMSIEELRKLYQVDGLADFKPELDGEDEADLNQMVQDGMGSDEDGTDNDDDDESFDGDAGSEDDDETTLAREEKRQQVSGATAEAEISSLEKEGEMSIEDLRKLYQMDGMADFEQDGGSGAEGSGADDGSSSDDEEDANGDEKRLEKTAPAAVEVSTSDAGETAEVEFEPDTKTASELLTAADASDDDSEDFEDDGDDSDDETTIAMQEKTDRMNGQQAAEIDNLQNENELPLEELLKMYGISKDTLMDGTASEAEGSVSSTVHNGSKTGDLTDGSESAAGTESEVPFLALPYLSLPSFLPYLSFPRISFPHLSLPSFLPYLSFPCLPSIPSLPFLTLPSLPFRTFPSFLTVPSFLAFTFLSLPYLTLPYLTFPFLTLPLFISLLVLPFLTFLHALAFPYLGG
jgi:superfamily II DNA/RNA helicase